MARERRRRDGLVELAAQLHRRRLDGRRRVVLWGAHRGDIAFGGALDRKREQQRQVLDELMVSLARRVTVIGLTLGLTAAEVSDGLRRVAESGVVVRRR